MKMMSGLFCHADAGRCLREVMRRLVSTATRAVTVIAVARVATEIPDPTRAILAYL
jgi:hypothetical protein